MTIQIDQEFLLSTLIKLVQINSINPSLAPDSAGEEEIASFTAGSMTQIGLEVSILESVPGRPTVVGVLPGSGGNSLMLNAHYDTVGIANMSDPFSAAVDQERLYGRGVYDMKSGLAANMAAAKAIKDAGLTPPGDLVVAAVADEEYASIGTMEVIEHFPTDAAIVTEPTQLQICVAHKGFIWLNVDVNGRAAHGSRYDLGLDANMKMGRFLAELDKLERSLRNRKGHPLLGTPSLHAAVLQGGTELSAYADRCQLQVERRTIPGDTEDRVVAELQGIVDNISAEDETFSAAINSFFVRSPFEADLQSKAVGCLRDSAARVLGYEPATVGEMPWMDSALLSEAGIDTVVMGVKGAGAHSHEEWVDLNSVSSLALILAQAAMSYDHR